MSDTTTHAESLPGDHLDRLIHSHLDDSLSAEGVWELEGLLRDSATARARFWELAEVDGLGRDAARLAWGESPADEASSGTSTSKSSSKSPVGSPSDHAARGGWPHGRWIAAAVAGAVVSSLVTLTFIPGLFTFPIGSGVARGTAQTAPVSPPPLATVTNARFLLTNDETTPLAIGQSLAAGEISLLGGAVELTLRNGVVITLEGPADLDLGGEMEAFLHDGNVVVRMPKGTDGFRLKTTTADVLDLGTEFAVKASRDAYTDVQVYDGAVMATGRSDGSSPRFPRRLEAGQSARFSPHGPEKPEPILYSESRFVRRLPAEPGVPLLPHAGLPLDAAAELRLWGRPQADAITVHRAPATVSIDGRLDEWQEGPGFLSYRDGTPSCPEWVDGRMMYDGEHLYIAAHVGDPEPMRSVIDPAIDPVDGWRGGSVQVRVSTDRAMGWPADGNTADYYVHRQMEPTAAQKAAAQNLRFAHLTLWYHAASQTPCLTINHGMLLDGIILNPVGARGAFTRDADGKGYTLEYAIPWPLMNCADDPPRSGDRLAAVWQVNWSDAAGRMRREHMVEVHNPHESLRINVWERAATWGRAEYQ